ncbi:twin-arginine translocation signal domain-containing protein, partial [Streptomyces sp. SID10244]|nr:twin-arginine translocation signal domain-containing protein [Streptomyces sp. SID10244]
MNAMDISGRSDFGPADSVAHFRLRDEPPELTGERIAMDEAANAKVGVSRRTFLTTSAAIGLGATVATSMGVRSASAAPLGTGSAMAGG